MAFVISDEDKAENNKQHLNLSMLAYEVILSDMFAFGDNKLSGFINVVFEHYYPMANASISRTLNRLNGEVFKLLSDISGDERTKKRILARIVAQKTSSLLKEVEAYGSGKSFKFWLNNKNLEYLTEASSECGEDEFYARRGKYIKCVLEEYARLPYVERELVYFHPFVEAINAAIKEERQLRIVTEKGTIYSVYPYEILCDPLSTTNYLVGYSKHYDDTEEEKKPCSFKISALKSVRVEKSKSAFLKSSDRKQLAQKISSRGVQFMVGEETEVHVKLTHNGICRYRRQSHLRPSLIKIQDENIFVFQCTLAQAEFYFFKFGKDSEIISPLSLREKFMSMYSDAVNTYAKINTQEMK